MYKFYSLEENCSRNSKKKKKVTYLATLLFYEANLPEISLVFHCLSYFIDEVKSVALLNFGCS